MKSQTEPEILRLPLEQLCLQIKAMGILDVSGFLGKALSPPPISNINDAVKLLEDVNALGKDGKLTPLGKHVSLLPTDVKVGKMLVFGAIFKCIDPILTIAACISGKGPFNSPMDKRDEAKEAQKIFANFKSDHIAAASAFQMWAEQKGKSAQKAFCEKYFLSMTNLMAISDLRKQFYDLLCEIGYVTKPLWESLNTNSKKDKIVKSVILAGLQPNIVSINLPRQTFDKTAEGSVAVLPKSNEIHYFSNSERVFLHPSSTLFGENKFSEAVITYSQKVATSKVFVRDASVAPSIALLLLGGPILTLHGGNSVSINNVRFQAFPRISALISGMRRLLDKVLEEKIQSPLLDILDSPIGILVLDLLS